MNRIRRDAPNPEYDNSDILAPATALQLMTDRITEMLAARGVVIEHVGQFRKNGALQARVPQAFKKTQLRDVYQKVLRMLSLKEAGAPSTPNIREEFEVAVVTAYRSNSHHVFYIEAMYRSFFENMTLEMHNESIGYELHVAGQQFTRESAQAAYVTAFDNVLRFHPLYVAYLYGASGDIARENLLLNEAVDYMEWLFKRG